MAKSYIHIPSYFRLSSTRKYNFMTIEGEFTKTYVTKLYKKNACSQS